VYAMHSLLLLFSIIVLLPAIIVFLFSMHSIDLCRGNICIINLLDARQPFAHDKIYVGFHNDRVKVKYTTPKCSIFQCGRNPSP